MDKEEQTYTCIHGRKLTWGQARVIVEKTLAEEERKEAKANKTCLYDALLKGEKK